MVDAGDVFSEAAREAILEHNLRALETKFFKGIAPVKAIVVTQGPEFPARYLPEADVIQINEAVAQFPKLSKFLIVHELIHRKLNLQNPAYAKNPYSENYREEVRRLCKDNDYIDLL